MTQRRFSPTMPGSERSMPASGIPWAKILKLALGGSGSLPSPASIAKNVEALSPGSDSSMFSN